MKINRGTIEIEKASKIFTDREEPRAAFWKKYELLKDEQAKEDVHVLTYYGIGGIGKTSLLKKLREEMCERLLKPHYVHFDFNVAQASHTVLAKLKNKMVQQYKFSFPLFELGYYVYANKIGEKPESLEVKQFAEKSPILSLMMSVLETIPIVGLAAQVLTIADQGAAYIRTHLKNHSQELKQIELMETEDLYNYLPRLFAEDMASNVEILEEPFVVFLDTYECLVNELSQMGEPLKNDEWIRNGLVINIPNVLWVIAGREKLKWEYFDKDWKDALEQHILGNLSFADSDFYMKNAGVMDEELREKLYQLTSGTPVYLDLCVEQYGRIINIGETPDITMFGDDTRTLIERFIRYMGDSQKDLIYMLACLEQWNDELINAIAFSVLPNFSLSGYEKSKGFSFVTELDNGYYCIHQTVGEVLYDDCPQSIKMRTADGLIAHFGDIVEGANYVASDYMRALTYFVRAGLLKYSDNDEFCKFYQDDSVRENLKKCARGGLFQQVRRLLEMFNKRIALDSAGSLRAVVTTDLALLERVSGRYEAAVKHATEAVELCKEAFGETHIHTLTAKGELGRAYERVGKYDDALELQEELYELEYNMLGGNDEKTIDTKIDMAWTLMRLGNYTQALEMSQELVEENTKLFGESHPNTLGAISALSAGYYYLKKYEKSVSLDMEVWEKEKEVLGKSHPTTLSTMNNLGFTYGRLKEYDKAAAIFEELLEERSKVLGREHPNTLSTMGGLAITYGHLKKYEKAVPIYEELLESRSKVLGRSHPSTLHTMNNLAVTYGKLKEYDKAAAIFEEVLEERSRVLGNSHPTTLSTINSLAKTYYYLNKYERTVTLYEKILEEQCKVLGKEHSNTLETMHNLAMAYDGLGKYEKSLLLYEEVLDKRTTLFGKTHFGTLRTMYQISKAYVRCGEYRRAIVVSEELLEKEREILGENHKNTLDTMNTLALAYLRLDEYEKAISLYEKELEEWSKFLDEKHPIIMIVKKNLSYAYRRMGEHKSSNDNI